MSGGVSVVTLQAEQWRTICRAVFLAAGATEINAARVTEALVDSNLVGHDSHGVIRVIQYLQAIEAGHVDPAAEPEVVQETAVTSLIDGKWTFGQVSAGLAMKKAIEKGKQQGIALSALIRGYHIGRLGEYSEMAYNAGMIGMVIAGGFGGSVGASGAGVAPYGGAKPTFGTNPISFGIPAGTEPPVLVDFASSAVAAGKIALARAKGTPLPSGWIVDKDGNPSTDAEDFYNGGALLTFGSHKGYGLAVAIELLGQALTGGDDIDEAPRGGGTYTRSGSIFVAIDPGIFRPLQRFTAAVDATVEKIKAVPPAAGFDEVLLPGEPEQRSRARRLVEGISLPDNSWETLKQLASGYGVDVAALVS